MVVVTLLKLIRNLYPDSAVAISCHVKDPLKYCFQCDTGMTITACEAVGEARDLP